MKKNLSIIAVFTALLFTGCTTTQIQQSLGTAEEFKSKVVGAGIVAKSYISAENRGKIHAFAEALLATTDNVNLDELYKLLPSTTGSTLGDILLNTVLKPGLNLVVAQLGSHNKTTIDYAHKGAEGLLANF